MTHPAAPRRVYVEPTTRCNLRCPMCVKASPHSAIPEADLSMDTLLRLLPDLAQCATVIFSGIGEPTLHPDLPEFVRRTRAVAPQAVIGVQSNGLLLTEALVRALVEAGLSRLCLSVDSATPAPRGHLPTAGAESLLRAVRQAAPQLDLGCQMVLHRDNWQELPEMVDLVADAGGNFLLVSHLLPYAASTHDTVLFRYDTDEALAFFEARYAEARREGLDLRGYDAIMWNYGWTDTDKRVVNTAQTLVREAVERGHPMHVRRLLREVDSPLAAQRAALPELFARATRRAAQRGLRLRLPKATATTRRSCPFLEEDWAFVDTSGRVSPCHYLWHEYACWPDNACKKVWPMYFGSVDRHSLAELWNTPDWREFRHDGLSYAYADCFSCNGVCPDTNGKFGPFTVDCHARNVPCGHCPWCHGAVDCLRDI